MATLPTNLKDDILDASVNQRRRYNMITNPDGTVEFEDVTVYSQVGSEYGAGLINETNKQINGKVDDSKIVRDLKTIGAMTQEGFVPDALALKEVNESLETKQNKNWTKLGSKTGTSAITLPSNFSELKITCKANNGTYWRAYSFYVIKSELSTNSERWVEGFGYNPNHYLCELSLSSNSVALSTFLEASVELTSNATITVYYR